MSTATAQDGAPDTVFLPAGIYTVSLFEYQCGTKIYFAAERPEGSFEVTPAVRTRTTLKINSFSLEALPTYDNPRGEKCRSR